MKSTHSSTKATSTSLKSSSYIQGRPFSKLCAPTHTLRNNRIVNSAAATPASTNSTVPLCAGKSFHIDAPIQPRSAWDARDAREEDVEEYDVLGLGQLMIDYAATVEDSMLETLDVPKGGRRVISVAERAAVMERLQGFNSQVSAGGSLANSLVGISQLAAAREGYLAKAAATSTTNGSNSSSSSNGSSSSSTTAAAQQRRIRVAMAGCSGGTDALGEFGRAQMAAAGVDIIPVGNEAAAWSGSATGTVMVFTTPDAQRSFLSSFSSEDRLHLTPELLSAVSRARLLVVEGYLWELPGAAEVIPAVVQHARAVGTLVVLTAGDASVVQRHGAKVLEAIRAGVDMFVSNVAEAQELVQYLHQQQHQQQQDDQQPPLQQQQEQKEQLLQQVVVQLSEHHQQQQQHQHQQEDQVQQMLHSIHLDPQGSASLDSLWDHHNSVTNSSSSSSTGHVADGSSSGGEVAACELAGVCPLVVVTDGSRGSYITALGQLIVVPPYWRSQAPVDTCGAGDAYCSGFLFAFLLGLDLHTMGHTAAKTASAVISRHGPQLLTPDADWVAGLPLGRTTSSSSSNSGSGSGSGSSFAASLISNGSSSSSTSIQSSDAAAAQLQSLGLLCDGDAKCAVDAKPFLQGASQ